MAWSSLELRDQDTGWVRTASAYKGADWSVLHTGLLSAL